MLQDPLFEPASFEGYSHLEAKIWAGRRKHLLELWTDYCLASIHASNAFNRVKVRHLDKESRCSN